MIRYLSTSLKQTPLSKIQQQLGPVLGNFAGYNMPMKFNYNSVKDVVTGVRNGVGIFDVSHMGYIKLSSDNISNINRLLEKVFPINTDTIKYNESKLSILLNNKGYIQDDLIIGNVNNHFRLIVNASNKYEILTLLQNYNLQNKTDVNISLKDKVILAIQGPKSQPLLNNILQTDLSDLFFNQNRKINCNLEISRTGYTGEDGFELYFDPELGEKFYKLLINYQKTQNDMYFGGLIERDILRLEAGLCLSGNEFGDNMEISFPDLNMNFLIGKKRRNNGDFIGYDKMVTDSEFIRTGFISKKPVRPNDLIYNHFKHNVGFITSSNKSYNLNKFISMGYVRKDNLKNIYIINKDKQIILEQTNLPFIPHNLYK